MAESQSREISLPAALLIWAGVVLLATSYGLYLGLHGPRFTVALGVAAGLFAFEFFLAVRCVREAVQGFLMGSGGNLAPLLPLLAALIYTVILTGDWRLALAGAAYAILPALLLAGAKGKPPGAWEDYASVALIWAPVEFHWMHRVFPYPPVLSHSLSILMALGTGTAAFLLVRRLDGVGYSLDWRRGFTAIIVLHFLIFAAIAIPLGLKMHFLFWAPSLKRLRALPLSAVGILYFTAWPEEFLFRGLLQNCFSGTLKNSWLGLIAASAIFGLSHILHTPYPNWKYVLLATIAGLFYGHLWMRTRSLLPGALVHGLVDISWHLLFR